MIGALINTVIPMYYRTSYRFHNHVIPAGSLTISNENGKTIYMFTCMRLNYSIESIIYTDHYLCNQPLFDALSRDFSKITILREAPLDPSQQGKFPLFAAEFVSKLLTPRSL